MKRFIAPYGDASGALFRIQSPFLLAVRTDCGWRFVQTGFCKVHNIATIMASFASLNLFFRVLRTPCIAEFKLFSGIFLIFSLGTRLIGFLVADNTLVAYGKAGRQALVSICSNPSEFYVAAPSTFLFAALIVLIFGEGYLSVDHMVAKRLKEQA